ncbi:MAG TPA: class II glutamine amidotransferase [Streptosporangiaceae bacterium]|jgi:predicted glutamine amidotransferase
MCRLLGYCAKAPVSLAGLLGEDGLADFTALSALHGDGWGMGWYAGDGELAEPALAKSVGRAVAEPAYQDLARRPLGPLGLVHLRWATPGLAVQDGNSHPFRYGEYVMAHNGAIHPQDRLGELLPPAWERQVAGTTDSERYFLHLMGRLAERDGDVIAAIGDTTADIAARFAPNSLNAILLAPGMLYAISWHEPARIPREQLRLRGVDSAVDIEAYFDLSYTETAGAVVVASSGWPAPGWTPLPRGHVLAVDQATGVASVIPIPAGALAPAS